MSTRIRGAGSAPSTAPHSAKEDTDAAKPLAERRTSAAGAGGLVDGLKPAPAQRQPSASIKRMTRSPATRERLGKLRSELGKISPAPSSLEEARAEIIKALVRASLGDWTVPELSDEKTARYADGSAGILLLAHVILINPTGAFRIVALHPPRMTYFEAQGLGNRRFTLPADASLQK